MAEENEELRDEELENEEQEVEENQVDPENYKKLMEEKQRMEKRIKELNESDKKRRLKLKELEETLGDTDPEEIKRLKQEREEAERKKAEEKGQFDKLRQQLEEQKEKAIRERDEKLQQMSKTLERHLIDGSIATAMSKYDVDPDMSDVLMSHIRPQFQVVQEDGEYQQRVVDEHGDPQLNMMGEFKTVEDVFKEMKENPKYGVFFRGNKASGGGSTPGRNSTEASAPPRYKSRESMTDRQKIDFIKEYGRDEYEKIPVSDRKASQSA